MKKMFITLGIIIFVVVGFGVGYMYLHPMFGGKASGTSLDRIKQSKHWNGSKFQNKVATRMSTRDKNSDSYFLLLKTMLFPPKDKNPTKPLPSQKFDKENFSNGDMVWFGHSTMMLKTDDRVLLSDPVFNNAAPIPGVICPFEVEHKTEISDLPDSIDVVIISHDHYDHLDYRAIQDLDTRTENFFVGLGVKAHLLRWGIAEEKIKEFDRYDDYKVGDITFVFTPTRHFSGRGLTNRNSTLWGSWVIQGNDLKVFFSGDSGYFDEFKQISNKHGPFDVAFIENGAYNDDWAEIHMKPEQSVQVSIDLKAKLMVPIHWGKFDLSRHHWDEPIKRNLQASQIKNVAVATPIIGQIFNLNNVPRTKWWNL